jgi:lipopolysaccharide export system protein LptC
MRAEITGETMRHYPDTDTLEIDDVHVRAVSPDGRVTLAQARMALANGDGSEVQLRGGARVLREPMPGRDDAIEFRGEFLHAILDAEQVRSHLPVTITQGGMEIHAQAMQYDNVRRVVQLGGRLTASFPSNGGVAARK